ncbi:hypothetical protein AA313_de0202544 [Arthrobotrys entomopaga]|nr:hypothetical protein AA313_de0202544 [Arthrobotrys entomopaga]
MSLGEANERYQPFPRAGQRAVHVHMQINITHIQNLVPSSLVRLLGKTAVQQTPPTPLPFSNETVEPSCLENIRNLFPPCKQCAPRLALTANSGNVPSIGVAAPPPPPPPPPPDSWSKTLDQSSVSLNPRDAFLADIRAGKKLNRIKPPTERNMVLGPTLDSSIYSQSPSYGTPPQPKQLSGTSDKSCILSNPMNNLLTAIRAGKSLNHVKAPSERNAMAGRILDLNLSSSPQIYLRRHDPPPPPVQSPKISDKSFIPSNSINDLCEAISVGKQLNHVNPPRERYIVVGHVLNNSVCSIPSPSLPSPPPPPPPSLYSNPRSDLLAETRAGKSLNRVKLNAMVRHATDSVVFDPGSGGSNLRAALEITLSNGRSIKMDKASGGTNRFYRNS